MSWPGTRRRRDPTPQTPDNPARETFYRAVRYANQTFREGGAAQIPGWRTDRGRVFLKYGDPGERLRHPQAVPRAYEVWTFTQGQARYYAFLDDTGFGHYVLIGTNDVAENAYDHNNPGGWIYSITTESALVNEILQFIRR